MLTLRTATENVLGARSNETVPVADRDRLLALAGSCG